MTIEQAINLMRLVRKFVEAAPDGIKIFPWCKFYGDWLAHNELNNVVALGLIEKANDAIIDDGLPLDLIIPELFGLSGLRQELDAIIRTSQQRIALTQTRSAWMVFVSLILGEIVDQPIGFTDSFVIKGKSERLLAALRKRVAEDHGFNDSGYVPIFHQLHIATPPQGEDEFLWMLSLRLPSGEIVALQGTLIVHDFSPFLNEDIPLNFAPTGLQKLEALDRLFDSNTERGRLLVRDPRRSH